ncbi:MAG TPA: lysophospholipid acyltransferase family protein [Chitinispirillaceae bacterium]|nr:lysophospholipid acyltransferase family protein [Chitinispirillaceae bacterium]
MAGKNSGLKEKLDTLRVPVFILWIVFSTVLYGVICIMSRPFSIKAARFVARLWNLHLLAIGGVRVKVSGAEKLDRSKRYVFISNHQSALDIPVIFAGLTHPISFIAKKELFMIPFFGWGIAALGHIWIDRSNARKAKASIDRAVRHLQKGNISLILFPEGTRSEDGKVGEFKQASFTLAIQAGVQVVPVAIRNACSLLPKKSAKIRTGTVYLDILQPLDVTKETTKTELCGRVYEIIKEQVEGNLNEFSVAV